MEKSAKVKSALAKLKNLILSKKIVIKSDDPSLFNRIECGDDSYLVEVSNEISVKYPVESKVVTF